MGNLTENKTPGAFPDDLTQIETPDPVLGGDGGPPNVPNRQLGERTWWLKNALTSVLSSFNDHDSNTNNPHQVTKAQVGLSDLPNAVSDSVSLDSSLSLATSAAVKIAYDKAVEAFNLASTALTKANGAITEAVADTLYVRRSEVSGSVTSTSQTNVGSSLAVKTAYDKALEALTVATGVADAGDNNAFVLRSDVKDAVNSTSQTTVGSSRAVKTAYDKAVAAETLANSRLALSVADGRYIRLTARSSSVASTSTSTVATSRAVKIAYDKAVSASFPAGTRMLFVQAYAPVGWTKVTTHNNKALRIVSGNGGGSGGSQSFTNALKSQTISGSTSSKSVSGSVSVHNHTLSEAQMPHHWHDYGSRSVTAQLVPGSVQSAGHSTHFRTSGKGGTQGHSHGASFSGSSHNHSFSGSINLAVQYVDAIICQKS